MIGIPKTLRQELHPTTERDIGGTGGISRKSIRLFNSGPKTQDSSSQKMAESILVNILTACGEPWMAF